MNCINIEKSNCHKKATREQRGIMYTLEGPLESWSSSLQALLFGSTKLFISSKLDC